MTSRQLIFGLNCYVASVAALFISFCFELPNPWWAAITVYITSQPITGGQIWAKAIHRVGGTLIGLAMALLIIPNLVDAPELMMLALALWLSLCLFLSLQIRTPASYVVLLAGYSTALVGLPIIDDPSTIFDTAVARTEEIMIGVMCASAAHGVIFPLNTDDVWSLKLRSVLSAARAWIPKALRDPQQPYEKARMSFPSDVVELAVLGTTLRFEPRSSSTRGRAMFALERRLIAILPLVAAVERRSLEFDRLGPTNTGIGRLVEDVAEWIGEGPDADPERESALKAACGAEVRARWGAEAWTDLVSIGLAHRLSQLVTEWHACLGLARHLDTPDAPVGRHLAGPYLDPKPHSLHIDRGLALASAITAGTALLALSAFAMIVKWPVATTGIGLTAVMTSLFATADDPTPMQTRLFVWTLLSIPVAMFYVWAVLPAADGFVQLAIALFPLNVTMGAFMAVPKHMLRALSVALLATTLIGLQPVYRADFIIFTNQVVSAVLGILAALVMTKIFRIFNAELVRRRVERASQHDLAELALRGRPQTAAHLATRMLDRVGLITSRLSPSLPAGQAYIAHAMRNLHLGVDLIEILDGAASLSSENQPLLRRLRDQLKAHIEADRTGNESEPGSHVPDISPVARAFAQVPLSAESETGLSAAVGLQLTLREEAAAPV